MIQVTVKTSTAPARTTQFDPTVSTPQSVIDQFGINSNGTAIRLDGKLLNSSDMAKTFEELGVDDGSAVTLSSIVKADGANTQF